MTLEEEYRDKLKRFIRAYQKQKEALEGNDCDIMTLAMKEYMEESRKLLEFKKDAFSMPDPELPALDVYFQNESYCGFALQVFGAMLDSDRAPREGAWELFERVYVGELLKNRKGDKK